MKPCAHCQTRPAVPGGVFCGTTCRVRAHRVKVSRGRIPLPPVAPPPPSRVSAIVAPTRIDRPARFAYCDPPYPGAENLYPERSPVDGWAMVAMLCRHYPDGWALSTSAEALPDVLTVCPRGIRVLSWVRGARPFVGLQPAWEPVVLCGGRVLAKHVPSAIVGKGAHGWDLPGAKPGPFYDWLWSALGGRAGDRLDEPFPGSGIGRAAARNVPPCLERGTFPRPRERSKSSRNVPAGRVDP